jgi:structural maintenance of chromosome 1
MGKLFKLEIENFKSYAGTQVIGPFQNFSCVVGPNGAGKSNLMDAVSFVLGIQARFLRSTQLKELIYRKDANSPPARKTTVKLFYEVATDEVVGMKTGEFLIFSRTVTSNGASTYRYNDSEVTYEQYEIYLQNIGVLVKVRNFLVFQGDVESIASKTPIELTKLIEHICGSETFGNEYELLKKQKEEAEESTIFSMQKKKMFVSQFREVKIQKEEAEEYQRKKAELEKARTNKVLWNLWKLQTQVIDHQKIISTLQEEIVTTEDTLALLNKNLNSLKIEATSANGKFNSSQKSIAKFKSDKEKLGTRLLPLRNKLQLLKSRLKDAEKTEGKLIKENKEKDSLVKNLAESVHKSETEIKNCKESMDATSLPQFQLTENQMKTYSELKTKASLKTSSYKTQLVSLEMEANNLLQALSFQQSQRDSVQKDLSILKSTVQDYQGRKAQLTSNLTALQAEYSSLTAEQNATNKEVTSSTIRFDGLHEDLRVIDEKLKQFGQLKQRGRHEQDTIEAIGRMQLLYKGVHGKLQDLCRPIQKKYAKAISVAAGRLMDAIVVDNKGVAAECMRWAKEQRIGVFTFLPLDNIQSPSFPERLRQLDSSFRPCIDLVECTDIIRPAVSYALDTTLVCDTLSSAQNLCFQRGEIVKVVTLQGQIISRSGAMTGGTLRDRTDRWEEKDIENTRKQKLELEKQLLESEKILQKRAALREMGEKGRHLLTKIEFFDREIRLLDDKISNINFELNSKTSQFEEYSNTTEKAKSELGKSSKELESLKASILAQEQEVFADFSAKVGVDNILVFEDQLEKKTQQLREEYQRLSKIHSSLKAQLDYQQRRDVATALERITVEIANLNKEIDKVAKEEDNIQQQMNVINSKLDESISIFEKNLHAKTSLEEKVNITKKEYADSKASKDSFQKRISNEELLVERTIAELIDLFKSSFVEEITLPLESSKKEDSELVLDLSSLLNADVSLSTHFDRRVFIVLFFSFNFFSAGNFSIYALYMVSLKVRNYLW